MEKMKFDHATHFEKKMEPLPGGSGKYAKYGMDNAKEAKEKADKLASYAKANRPKGQ